MNINLLDLGLYAILYSCLGWVVETGCYAITRQRFSNRGILSMPLLPSWGAAFFLLLQVLPTLGERHVIAFLTTLAITAVVEALSRFLMDRLSAKVEWQDERPDVFTGSGKGFAVSAAVAAFCYVLYLLLQPLLMGLAALLPRLVKEIVVFGTLGLAALDLMAVLYAIRKGGEAPRRQQAQRRKNRLAQWLSDAIWRRLRRAYPGIQELPQTARDRYPFAKGLCFDKLVWVFLICALLGDGIETLFCGLVNGAWMSRSSVLYGPFSFVWGLGAVVLTITLQPLAQKNDRYVFLAGFVIGGVYEYMCSVFTEVVFGTVFWDYSHMPLNIGGRTNALFCFFWGVLAVVWVKIIYPRLSAWIEKVPAIAGKVTTWVVLFLMLCNAALTCGAMMRYQTRTERPEPDNFFETFLDEQYDDAYMKHRWPNMKAPS